MEFKALLKKEFLERLREHKIIIIFMGFMFFAFASPIIFKLLPEIMEDTYGSEITSLINISAAQSVSSYIGKDMIQICILVLVLTLGGVLSSEIKNETIVLPITKGGRRGIIAGAKILYYSIIVFLISFISVCTNIFYSYIVFNEDMPKTEAILSSSLKSSVYVLLILSTVFFFSSIFKNSIITSIAAMGVNLAFSFLNTLDFDWNPYKIIVSSSNVDAAISGLSFTISILAAIALFIISIYIFKRKNIYE